MFETAPLYLANFNSKASVCVNQGGTSSGKTYSILQVLFSIAISEVSQVITVAGQDIPNLKVGAIRDALDIIQNSEPLKSLLKKPYNKSDRILEFKSGSIIEFKSYDDEQDAKSGKRDYLFLNEANGVPYVIWEELYLRTKKRAFIDYNPNSLFWVHEKIIGQDNVDFFISDHRHNPFLKQAQRDKIEKLKEKDLDLWKVYARGMTGKIEGLIFRNWSICEKIPEGAKFIGNGLDFGFTNDPTANVDVFMQNGELWIDELIYTNGLTNHDICKALEGLSVPKRRGIIADSAEPKSIEEIRRQGWAIEQAQKGPDSINISISGIKNYHLNITKSSTNIRKELMNYKWKVDRLTGNPVNEPVDAFNHAIDAIRYVYLNRLLIKESKIRSGVA